MTADAPVAASCFRYLVRARKAIEPGPADSSVATRETPAASTHIDTTDELQLSPAAQMAGKLSEIPDIRWERVNQIKAAIADGTYMTDEKMSVALDRLLDEIA